jgi:hypothetical protein
MSRINVNNFRHPDGTSDNISLDSSGRVGVGTTSPAAKLDVSGNVQFGDGGGFDMNANGTRWQFSLAGTERMRIDSSGNLKFNSGYGSAATAYGCRAWVNFNGTGTVAIRASGNVSSITDNGTGDYTVNFTTAMPDANYASVSGMTSDGNAGTINPRVAEMVNQSSSAMRMRTLITDTAAAQDLNSIYVAIFR